jgi:hypothetical protein
MASVKRPKSRTRFLLEELLVDAAITAVILWVLVLLGEPLAAILTNPVFIVIIAVSIAYIAWKTYRHEPADGGHA